MRQERQRHHASDAQDLPLNRRCSWALAIVAAVACTLRAPRIDGTGRPCSIDGDCSGDVCYAGLCRTRATRLAAIYAEVSAADPQLGVLQVASIDPRLSPVINFQLVPVLAVSGTVLQDPDPTQPGATPTAVPGASVVFTDADAGIPGRAQSLSTTTDSFGDFALTIPASSWNTAARPPSSPPLLDGGVVSSNVSNFQLEIPAPSSISATIVSGDAGVGGLLVTAVTTAGDPLGPGAKTLAPDGSFRLSLPPQTPTYALQIGPSSPTATIPTFNPRIVTPPDTPTVFDIGPLPAPTLLSGRVVDVDGGPVKTARVEAVSTDVTGWVMSRQTDVDPSGAFTLLLVEGNYVVEAVPDPDPAQPGLSGAIPVGLDGGIIGTQMPPILCPPKAHAKGTVLQPDGRPGGPGYQIVASRLPDSLVSGRPGTATPTDAAGSFELVGDPGQYRLTVLPTPESGLPLTYAVVQLTATGDVATLPPITAAPPVQVFGSVFGAGKAPVQSAAVSFYALDSTGQRAVLIGSTLTDANGAYSVVLPDVADPAGP
jgi:hypothetical protein